MTSYTLSSRYRRNASLRQEEPVVSVKCEGANFLVRASADPNSSIPLCVPTNTPDSDHKIMSGHDLVWRWLPLHGQLSSSHGAGMSDSS